MATLLLPEELLERVLSLSLDYAPRPQWLPSRPTCARLAPLCVSRQFNRIATPLLYHTVRLSAPHTARLLQRTLHDRPEHAQHIRTLVVLTLCAPVADILRRCQGLALSTLDLTICFDDEHDNDNDLDMDTDVFARLTGVMHLILRKPSNVYLSLPRPRALILAVARAIPTWNHLHTANIAFKLSDDTPTSPIATSPLHPFSPTPTPPGGSGPITTLSTALASSRTLHTFSTLLPSVWNTSIAHIATNPSLHRICLSPANSHSHSTAIPGTGLFLMEARRHARLIELVAAGTPIIRGRAHTLGTIPATTASSKPGVGLGLGLRIDTSVHAIGAAPQKSMVYQYQCMSPSSAPLSPVNPAWMGPGRRAQRSRR